MAAPRQLVQLTYPPGYAISPRWSPDGRTIIFYEDYPESRAFAVSPDGGSPRPLVPDDTHPQWDPNWSRTAQRSFLAAMR